MPTFGWVLEDAIDRCGEAQPALPPRELPPQIFTCCRCGRRFSSPDDLRRHYNLNHPLELPALAVRGELLLTETTLRNTVSSKDVELIQCATCEVQIDGANWQTLGESDFKRAF